tara:strand:+ start:183 stop:1196 length:1014 start_codon:yes stop_codon:yes gene_type:complete
MHRAVLLTDLHLRSDYLPGYLEAQLKTLTRLVNRKPPDSVVINGDIFHKRNPRGAELLAFRRLLEGLHTKKIYINRGNHDTIAKDGSTETTLTLFSDIATVISETTTVRLGTADFDFIPHYEDERIIVRHLKASKNHIFGHWGFDGCVANGAYEYESYIKKSHIGTKRFAFLGHIHKPKQYGKNIFVLGTQYSTSFGEANAQKYIHELLVRDGVVEVVRKPIDFGIRHVATSLDALEDCASRFNFPNFYTILRVKLDSLDEGSEQELTKKLAARHSVKHLEVVFGDVLPKYEASHVDYDELLTLDQRVIEEYIDNANTIFSKPDLLTALEEIRTYET